MDEILRRLGLEPDKEEEKRKFVFRLSHSLTNTDKFDRLSVTIRHRLNRLLESKAARTMHSSYIADLFNDLSFEEVLILYSCLLEAVKDTIQYYDHIRELEELYEYLRYLFEYLLGESAMDLGYSIDIVHGNIYKKGAEELDKILYEETLTWLASFPATRQNFETSLIHYYKKEYRPSISFAFDTIDSLAKTFLNKPKTGLDKLKEPLVKKLGLSPDWTQLLKDFCDYAHNLGRHGKMEDGKPIEVDEKEIEAFIYLTGTISRLIIRAINEEKSSGTT